MPESHPQLAMVSSSVSRNAFVDMIPQDEANADVPAVPVEDDSDTEHEGTNPKLLREMANSPQHLLTHRPFNRCCDACVMGKMKQKHKFRGAFDRPLKRWGEIITADHIDSKSDLNVSHEGHRFAAVVKDMWSKLFAIYPVTNKSGDIAYQSVHTL